MGTKGGTKGTKWDQRGDQMGGSVAILATEGVGSPKSAAKTAGYGIAKYQLTAVT